MLSKKICMLGTYGVGKSSLVRKYVLDVFDSDYFSTIGVQIYQKSQSVQLSGKEDQELRLVIWDLANIEKFDVMIKNQLTGAAAAIVVADLTRLDTFNEEQIHLKKFLEINPGALIHFAGNKHDLMPDPGQAGDRLQALAGQYGAKNFLTSAKTGDAVDSLFTSLGTQLLS